jgi:phage protein D
MEKIIDFARRVQLEVSIDGHDAASFLSPSLVSFEYTDQAAGKSDEIQIELHDRDDQWINGWLPLKGSVIKASITCRDWHGRGQDLFLDCGSFKCDEPAEYQGPPNKVSVKAVSATLTNELRETVRTKGWENYSLEGVAGELAQKHGLALYYDAPPHQFQRQDQRRESDLAFLQRLATARGINVKIHDGRMVMFAAQKGDAQGAALTINRKGGDFFTALEYSFKISSEGTGYDSATVEYHNPATRELRQTEYRAGGERGGEGKTLTLDSRVESEAEAQILAQSRLRAANQGELTGAFTIMGYPGLVSGLTLTLEDFGVFSGKYFVEKVSHKVGDKYTTMADIRQTLDY